VHVLKEMIPSQLNQQFGTTKKNDEIYML